MALDKKISELGAAAALAGPELVELVQAGANVQGTVNQFKTFIGASYLPLTGGSMTGDILFAANKGIDAGGAAALNVGATATVVNVGTGAANTNINIGVTGNNTIQIGNVNSTVNIMGTVLYENVTNLHVTDKLVTINKGGAAASGGGTGIEVEENAVITGYFKTTTGRDGYLLKAPGVANDVSFVFTNITAARSYTLPDASGTLALTSDAWLLASGGVITGVNTITSNASNQLQFNGTWPAGANNDYHTNFGGSFTSRNTAGDTLIAYKFSPTLIRNAGNPATQTLIAVDINPTFANGATNELSARILGGKVLIGNTTSDSITANTKVEIRGTGTTSDLILRMASSANNTRWAIQSNGLVAHTFGPFTSSAALSDVWGMSGTFNGRASQPDYLTGYRSVLIINFGANNQNGRGFAVEGSFNDGGGGYTGTRAIGYDYNPSAVYSGTTNLSFRSTSGSMLLCTSTSDSLTASTRIDVRGVSGGTIARFADSTNATVALLIQDHTTTPVSSFTGTVKLLTAPSNDNALTQVLVRDGSTGEVKYRTAASLGGGGGGSPGGAAYELQKNDGAGAFAGNKIFSATNGNLTFGTGIAGGTRTLTADGSASDVGFLMVGKGNAYPLVLQSGADQLFLGPNQIISTPTASHFILATYFASGATDSSGVSIKTGQTLTGKSGDIRLMTGYPTGAGKAGNYQIGGSSGYYYSAWQSMEDGIWISNTRVNPTGNPTNGVFAYVDGSDASKPKWRTPDGEERSPKSFKEMLMISTLRL